MDSLLYRMRYLLRTLIEENINFQNNLQKNVYISYSEPEKLLNKYLQLMLESAGLNVQIHNRDILDKTISHLQGLEIYLTVIPASYASILSEDSDFKREILLVVNKYPKCQIVFVNHLKVEESIVNTILSSTKRIATQKVLLIDFSPFIEEIYRSAKLVGDFIMPKKNNASDQVREIMTPAKQLITVTNKSKFSEMYYKMDTVGVRHCPVVDSVTNECLRIVSRRDVVDQVPPGNTRIPESVEKKYGIQLDRAAIVKEVMRLGKEPIDKVFPGKQNPLIHLPKESSIQEAIQKLATQHQLSQNKFIYLSGLAILDSDGILEGFVSYVDVLKRFIKDQESFLETTVSKLAYMPENLSNIVTITEDTTLSEVKLAMDMGYRTLPVIASESEDELVGMVSDLQVRIYNHRLLKGELSNLFVNDFMTSVERLYTPEPKDKLADCIDNFWNPVDGSAAAPSFAVCETATRDDGTEYKKLKGMFSYVDVLKKWQELNRSGNK